MKFSAVPFAIDSETGEKWVYGAAGSMMSAPEDSFLPAAPQQEYTLLQLEVLSGLALKYATRELRLASSWAA